MDPHEPWESETRRVVDGLRGRADREQAAARRLKQALVRLRLSIAPPPPSRRGFLLMGLAAQAPLLVAVTALGLSRGAPPSPEIEPSSVALGTSQVIARSPEPDCRPGWSCDPHPIAETPFLRVGEITQGESRIDTYACAPRDTQPGAESWFEFRIEVPTRLTAEIAEESDDRIDVDLHVLTARYGWGCIVQGDRSIDLELPPGGYFLVLDSATHLDPDQATTFDLTVRLTPVTPTPDDEPTRSE